MPPCVDFLKNDYILLSDVLFCKNMSLTTIQNVVSMDDVIENWLKWEQEELKLEQEMYSAALKT